MIDINGRLHSTEKNVNVVAGANEILDDDKGKKQSDINTETYSLVNDVNERLNGLSPDQQSALSVAAKATNNEIKLGYYVCGTEGNAAAKVISNATGYVLSTGGSIKVKMTNANTANNATLNINSTGVKPLYYDGERASANNTWEAGETVEVYYDGTNFYANNVAGSGGDGVFDVSEKYPTSGVEGGNTYTLDGALAVLNANLPASKKKGGMSIKFVQSSDNKYVQARCMAQNFTTDVTQWQGVDDEPTAGSENLVKSGGVYNFTGGVTDFTFDSRGTEHSSLNDRLNVKITEGEKFSLLLSSPASITNATVYVTYEGSSDNVVFGKLTKGVKKQFLADGNIVSIGIYALLDARSDIVLTIYRKTIDERFKETLQEIEVANDSISNLEKLQSKFILVGKGDTKVSRTNFDVKVGYTYLLSVNNINIDMTGVSSADGARRLAVKAFTKDGVEIGNLISLGVLQPLQDNYVFTIPENTGYVNIIMRAAVGAEQVFWLEDTAVVEANTKNMQNNLIDNILHIQDIPNTVTISGITFTNNGDGTITVNGTATANAILQFGAKYKSPSALGIKLGTNYYMRGCPAGGGLGKFKFNLDSYGAGTVPYNDFGQGCLVNIVSNDGTYNFRIVVYSGQTLNNLVFAPSLLEYKGAIKDHEERINVQENLLAPIAFENNAYYDVYGSIGDTATLEKTSHNQYKTAKIACQKGDMFIINATAGGVHAKTFTFVDNNNVILAPLFAVTKFDGVLIAPDNAAYIVISSNNQALVSYSCKSSLMLDTRARVLKLDKNNLDFYSIAPFGVNGVFNNSFSLQIPGDYAGIPMIASARAKFTTTGDKPTIRFNSGYYTSIWYTIGDEEFTIKEWRIPPSFNSSPTVIIEVKIPTGCALTITNFSCRKDRTIDRKNVGVMFDAHLGFQSAAPENTMAAYELAAQCNYPACIVNPIFNYEDVPYCYHEDTPCLSYQGGTTPIQLTAEEFAALTESDMNDYRVIGFGSMPKTFNEKIPRLEDFFYLCSVTGMRPVFSTHPAPTEKQWLIIKELLKKYRLLDKILIKAFSVGILETAYSILGDVYGFIYDVNGTGAEYHCNEMDNSTLVNFKGPKGIEYMNSNITKAIAETVISRGYFCSVWAVSNITGERYKELINWGVSEFVDDYNCSSGLNF